MEQTKHLASRGFKDPAAILVRVVVEDALRRLCLLEGIDSTAKAASLNEALRNSGRFLKPQWRTVQAWLDIGNAAAHGSFDDYTGEDVQRMIEDVERFLAGELG
jgi:HEPN domain-containing protein